MMYNRIWLEELVNENAAPDFLFFWGHQPSANGHVSASCFSQWWPSPFSTDGILYQTAEHWMMAGKASLFNNDALVLEILDAGSPGKAKALGRQVTNFDADIWDQQKFELVVQGNYLKFQQHQDLKNFLLNTGNKILVEASPVDVIWGIGLAADDRRALAPSAWKGENLLGFALMEVRDRLKQLSYADYTNKY